MVTTTVSFYQYLYAILFVAVFVTLPSDGFVIPTTYQTSLSKPRTASTTTLFLEKWVADMIDHELYRQTHKKEYENEWMNKNKNAVLHTLRNDDGPSSMYDDITYEDPQNFRQHVKDVKLAQHDPQRYCADRCISTGNCDVYEDIFDLTPEEVMSFCNDCVLATEPNDEKHTECQIPEHFYDIDDYFSTLKP